MEPPVTAERRPALPAAGALLVALVLRLTLLATTVDVPGDGPTRALAAYEWARAPYWAISGWWPPGPLYLCGLVALVVPHPFLAIRILNALAGTLTVAVLFLLARRVFGTTNAFVSAWLLACLPLHIELSASSLTESTFTLALIAGIAALVSALHDGIHWSILGVGLACFAYASMTRYEAWALLPIVPLYVLVRTRRAIPTLVAALVLALFPVSWTAGNAAVYGDPWLGFTLAAHGAEVDGAPSMTLPQALGLVARRTTAEAGWYVPLAAALGAMFAWHRRPNLAWHAERGLVVALWAMAWLLMLTFATMRGESLYARYLLFPLVLSLPLAALPLTEHLHPSHRTAAALVLLAIASLPMARFDARSRWVTRQEPAAMRALATWLRASPYRDHPLIITDMGWQASYLGLFAPEIAPRQHIVSAWMPDGALARIAAAPGPALVVTGDGEDPQRKRIESALRIDLDDRPPVHTIGAIRIREVMRGSG